MSNYSNRSIGKLVSLDTFSCVIELHSDIKNFCVSGYDDIQYFGQINSYVLIPQKNNFIVGEVVGLQESTDWSAKANQKSSPSVLKRGPAPNTLMRVVLIGSLIRTSSGYKYKSGVSVYPSLFSDILYITPAELDIIFGVNDCEFASAGSNATALSALSIGRSAVFHDYEIKIDIDSFFGSHSAVLGNTGSGKSCTISAILQRLYEKQNHSAFGSTFVIFDVNGEYVSALGNLGKDNLDIAIKYYSFAPTEYSKNYDNIEKEIFFLPHWFLNMEEWRLLLQASDKTQVPVLRNALRLAHLFNADRDEDIETIKNSILARCVHTFLLGEGSAASKLGRLKVIFAAFGTQSINNQLLDKLGVKDNYGTLVNQDGLLDGTRQYILETEEIPHIEDGSEFSFERLGQALHLAILYEESHSNNQIRNYCASLLTRFDSLKVRQEFNFLKIEGDKAQEKYLADFLGMSASATGVSKTKQIIILDMNSLEDELVEVVSSVLTRMIFQLLQKADPRNTLPINLILEEAHRYVPIENLHFPANRIFERIAKEGRKYGLFLLVSSQRPSELSRTVLSQCSNFVVHRIVNPEDLSYIRHMTPHVSDQILTRLPYLPSQHALVFGNAVRIPSAVHINTANPLPRSDNNAISKNWFIKNGSEVTAKLFPTLQAESKEAQRKKKVIKIKN